LMHRRILRGELWHWYVRDLALPLVAAGLGIGLAVVLRGQLILTRWQLVPVLGLAWVAAVMPAALVADHVRGRLLAPLSR
jgi:hypothetical protein